ncbi:MULTISPECIES: LysR substrate-binding domain-containing protein [unclassified Acinetobacter]|uniref:LysR substrate-binding domain-containing protein n=1 Tax=unclassified Acinetobacter TaxID=196816 RepID=UPI0029351583|nr:MULTISPECIES: LysR substrate-binding domain-containing protein [unclassified Acinetobacter]WOE33164.1 LysR substrate-binding domain-containing protein [Acinetobacter sp. SAAs470]WOE39826.1 LysR substrate-binding domain-containing protein [Acinetobacter sp. SAAs474]
MRLDLFDLQLVLYIVETGSLTKGAAQAALSLQACSERIKKLEQQYAVDLFTRHASGVKLTLAGQIFIQHAEQMIQQAQQLEFAMLPFSTGHYHDLILWCNSSAQSEYLPTLLPEYLLQNPNIHLQLKEAESSMIIHAIENGSAQLGLISSFFAVDHLSTLEFATDPLVLICPIQHRLASSQQLSLQQVVHEPFIGLMQHHSLQQSIDTQAKQLNTQIQYRLRLPNFAAIVQVIADGVGIAIIPQRAAKRYATDFNFQQIPLEGQWANRKLLLVAKNFADLSPAYQHLSTFLSSYQSNIRTNT